jgi:hypothetical protein
MRPTGSSCIYFIHRHELRCADNTSKRLAASVGPNLLLNADVPPAGCARQRTAG